VRVELHRYAYLPEHTLGRLYAGSGSWPTIERPWIANQAGRGGVLRESCVPDGEYRLIPHDSQRFPGTYALVNESLGVWYQTRPSGQTWGRTAILIHVGNRVLDVVGCIAIGKAFGELQGDRAVLNSGAAMNELRGLLGRTEHTLVIRPLTGTVEICEVTR
jgi:hypothetical protein